MALRHSYSGKFGRFDKSSRPLTARTVELLRRSAASNVQLELKDALEAIRNAPDGSVIYADPPYLRQCTRDRTYANAKMGDLQFHRDLAQALRARKLPFVLSTGDDPDVLALYSDCHITLVRRTSRVSGKTRGYSEVVVTCGL
jgi:site-specific DNA-adenine methylase